MKFNTIYRPAMAVAVSLALAFGTTACIRDYTADYVYSVSNSTGQVNAYAVDYQSGVLTQISGSPFTTNLTNPSTVVAAPNGKTIYVIGGSQNANVEVMSVGSDGKLYGEATPSLFGRQPIPRLRRSTPRAPISMSPTPTRAELHPGAPPVLAACDLPDQLGWNPGHPDQRERGLCPGCHCDLGAYLHRHPGLGTNATPNCVVLGSSGTTNNGTNQSFVYVVDEATTVAPRPSAPTTRRRRYPQHPGLRRESLQRRPHPDSGHHPGPARHHPLYGWNAGVSPSAIAIDPTGKYVYVTDKAQNEVYGYAISNNTTGALTGLTTSPYATGQYPLAITIEPRGKYVYVANYNSSTVSSYSLNLANGSLGASAGSNFTTTTGPTCVTVDPALGIYLYTSDYLDSSISGGQLSPNTGALSAVSTSFFPSVAQPICAGRRLQRSARRPGNPTLTLKATHPQKRPANGRAFRFLPQRSPPGHPLSALPVGYPRDMSHSSSFTLGNVTVGSGKLFLIAGPCVIESEPHARKLADAIQRIASDLGVPYIFKASYDKANRTSIRSFRGPGLEEGCRILRLIGETNQLPVLTDIHTPEQCAEVSDALGSVDAMLQIPAFLCRQTDLLIAAAHTGRAINVKKGQFVAPWDMRHAVEKIRDSGNTAHLPHRARRQLRLQQPGRRHALAAHHARLRPGHLRRHPLRPDAQRRQRRLRRPA